MQVCAICECELGLVRPVREVIDPDAIEGLAEAIRCGDKSAAEYLLDRIFYESAMLTERIQRGRYSMKARKAKAAPVPALRNVA